MSSEKSSQAQPELSRRRFLKNSAVFSTAAWIPAFRVGVAEAGECVPPPNLPAHLDVFRQGFENWSKGIVIDSLWTCAPRSAQDCVDLVNWAAAQGWQVRPRGAMHNWSPIHVTPDMSCDTPVILLSTTDYLANIAMDYGRSVPAVRAQAGVYMEDLLGFVEAHNLGMTAVPAPGDVTVGGVLAVDAHGTAVPAIGEVREHGHSYGSLSNLVLEVTVVAWDKHANAYTLQTINRSDREAAAVMTSLGRTLIVEAVLQLGENQKLRCQSFMDIHIDELLGPPETNGRTVAHYLDQAGRMEVIWFPFTDKPWLKVWSVAPTKPLMSREVTEPYNYPFSDNMPDEIEEMARSLTQGNKESTPLFGQMMYNVSKAGLATSQSADIWGDSKNVLLYIKPTTLRIEASGYAVLTRRDNVQRVIYDFTEKFKDMIAAYESMGEYPINMPVEIRVTGLDQPDEIEADRAEAPTLSAVRPVESHPEWDVAVWFDCLSFVGTEMSEAFNAEMEHWLHSHFDGEDALVRPEWSKGWAYRPEAAWTDANYIASTVPGSHTVGRPQNAGWNSAVKQLDKLDPQRVFSNDFLDQLLQRR
ncbi:FAD/FMN-containing dehydrogenase [Litorivivens lipolytica]|uniref:FAD/FMN-containing dehydrogenase n=1 Tax=Litorivivens lipolytica TaxID=1524264 RepID=A0A7W4W2T7_9GAMM|nr:cholesterol oxidase substrate-binding domain-containing protein [Litorivivens lipolytica]MBB3046123.1 FAD/FMN-containing dehydrogenase [Litorivivens lipolytica]